MDAPCLAWPILGFLMPRYPLALRHFDNDYLVDEPEDVQLSDDAAAREFALKVMRGLSSDRGRKLGGLDDGGHAGRPPGVAARAPKIVVDAVRRGYAGRGQFPVFSTVSIF
jgi:hypothetical protein